MAGLGHDVMARESSIPDVARITAEERPDVAIVIVHEGSTKALQLIDLIVHEAAWPRDRGARRAGRDVHQRGRQARHLRLHRRRWVISQGSTCQCARGRRAGPNPSREWAGSTWQVLVA